MSRYHFFALLLSTLAASPLFAQDNEDLDIAGFAIKHEAKVVKNRSFAIFYHDGSGVYNLRSSLVCSKANISDLNINPTGSSFALVSGKPGKTHLDIYAANMAQRCLKKIKSEIPPITAVFSEDSRQLAMAASDGSITIFDTQTYLPKQTIKSSTMDNKLAFSPDGYLLASTDGIKLHVWNLDRNTERQVITTGGHINDFCFSADGKRLAIVDETSTLNIYNTQDYSVIKSVKGLGDAKLVKYHPEDKYAAVVTGPSRIALVNTLDENDRVYIDSDLESINHIGFATSIDDNVFLVYSTPNRVIFNKQDKLTPHRRRIVEEEVTLRLSEWSRQRSDESLEEYKLRVNDKTRKEQLRLYENEATTRLASGVALTELALGGYSKETETLSLSVGNMNTIRLKVPQNEAGTFLSTTGIEVLNPVYGLTEDDKFELIYAEVRNNDTGRRYVYDNRDRTNNMALDETMFVSMELVQQAVEQEAKLEEVKQNVMEEAKTQNLISDHTNIHVSSEFEKATLGGETVTNYNIGYSYDVDAEFSERDDYAPGKYAIEQSQAGSTMLKVIQKSFETDFAQYIKEGKRLKITVTGMADAAPINGRILYRGEYGQVEDYPVYKDGKLTSVTLNKAEGITSNDQLAFARGLGVRDYILRNLPSLSKMKIDSDMHIEVSKEKGSAFRRISVVFTFIDAVE